MFAAEFPYDTSVIRTTNKNSDEIVNGFRLKQPIDLISITDHYKVSESASSFASSVASHVHELHKEISDKIALNNSNYELRADIRNKLKTFNVGDVKKLHASNVDPFQILNKLNDNALYYRFWYQFYFQYLRPNGLQKS